MTTQPTFTPAEWDLLVGAPALTALVLGEAHPCSPGLADAMLRTALAAMTACVPQAPGSVLIDAVLGAVRAGHSPRWPAEYPRTLTNVGQWALARCWQLAALLAQKAPEAEAEAYSHWLIAIGQQVALLTEDTPLADQRRVARARQRRAALEQIVVALQYPCTSDGMCALTPCWPATMP